jgi:hypothetical protein
MATAFLPFSNLFASVQALLASFVPRPAPVQCIPLRTPTRAVRVPARVAAQRPLRPLRVVRVLEPAAPRSTAGRMVISGRLADVCAELDRMAAQEARGH